MTDWVKQKMAQVENMQMSGKVVLITGASRGIGAAAALEFAKAGAKLALLSRDADRIAALAGQIGPAALAIPCDVGRFWEIEAAVNATVATFGRLDVLIGNAGVIDPIAQLADADPSDWGKAIDINLKGIFHGMRAALPVMLAQGGGTILTISAGAAHNAVEGWSAYCASKAGAAMLTRMADHENRSHGIRAMGLSPGTVATDMQSAIKASGVNPVSQLDWSVHIPADWPARALVWMCGAGADAYIGQEISLRDDAIRRLVGLI
jgi:NAD(P)-dependent dehydrogenase (short-subunit alcohol dehydrogenase family)